MNNIRGGSAEVKSGTEGQCGRVKLVTGRAAEGAISSRGETVAEQLDR